MKQKRKEEEENESETGEDHDRDKGRDRILRKLRGVVKEEFDSEIETVTVQHSYRKLDMTLQNPE